MDITTFILNGESVSLTDYRDAFSKVWNENKQLRARNEALRAELEAADDDSMALAFQLVDSVNAERQLEQAVNELQENVKDLDSKLDICARQVNALYLQAETDSPPETASGLILDIMETWGYTAE